MKGLLLSFGLVIALFVFDARATIYDLATYQAPKVMNTELWICNTVPQTTVPLDQCYQAHVANAEAYNSSIDTSSLDYTLYSDYQLIKKSDTHYDITAVATRTVRTFLGNDQWYTNVTTSEKLLGTATFPVVESSSSCPPDSFPNYIYEVDNNGDGQVDVCYDPNELDNLSKCSSAANAGTLLPQNSGVASTVCYTDENGGKCAYGLTMQGSTAYYAPDLELSCFGENEYPEYDPNPPPVLPGEEECKPYAGGYVCSANPDNYCANEYECIDGCGYVNKQFVCFRDQECTGASCEPAPVDCTSQPDAPVCKEANDTPTPSFCEQNPMVAGCQTGSDFCVKNPTAPSCNVAGGGSGGSSFNLDYDRLAQSMKDAAKTLIDEMPTPDFSDTQTQIDDKTNQLDEDIDGFMDGDHFNGMTQKIKENIFEGKFHLPSGGGCTAFTLGEHEFDLCDVAQRIRSLLYFVFGFLTMLYLKNLFFATVTPRKE